MKIVKSKSREAVDFAALEAGDCFEVDGDILIKSDYEQDALSLTDGEYYADLCGEMVIPIDAELHIIS